MILLTRQALLIIISGCTKRQRRGGATGSAEMRRSVDNYSESIEFCPPSLFIFSSFHQSSMPDNFIKQIIGSHNARRRAHGVPDLRWNDHLAAQAQAWAERVARQAHISYKELSGIGENITFFPRDLDPEAIVEHWYEEHEKYEYETPGWQCGTNYFTQVIWRETEEV
ncbi:hypothetical protein Y032_0115g484 [Ancylostoma ceylanicum]|uniref:SCP domain-containing protein n=1 Tax=Ancylostoma ceylanicum TaxID=53326 RepID=A0A016TCV5_9BILA|nr:hypothetical protein Y032_0115g484 [Ancylostoma ceylanicum]